MSSKLGRNDPCHCGSGKKYKKCCLDKDEAAERAKREAEKNADKESQEKGEEGQADPFYDCSTGYDIALYDLADWERRGGNAQKAGKGCAIWLRLLESRPTELRSLDQVQSKQKGLSAKKALWSVLFAMREAGRGESKLLARRLELADLTLAAFPESTADDIVRLRCVRAEALHDLGRVDEAEAAYREVIAAFPTSAEPYISWADLYVGMAHDNPEKETELLARANSVWKEGLSAEVTDRALIVDFQREWMNIPAVNRDFEKDPDLALLLKAGRQVPRDLWERMLARGAEIVPALAQLLEDSERLTFLGMDDIDECGELTPESFAPTHAAFLAACIGHPDLVDGLLELGRVEADSDWLSEGFGSFPSSFPPACLPKFIRFMQDSGVSSYNRSICARGVVWVAGKHPEWRPVVAMALAKALNSRRYDDGEMTTWLAVAGAATESEQVHEAIKAAGERGAINPGIAGSAEQILRARRDWFLSKPPEYVVVSQYLDEIERLHGETLEIPATAGGVPHKGPTFRRQSKSSRKRHRKRR